MKKIKIFEDAGQGDAKSELVNAKDTAISDIKQKYQGQIDGLSNQLQSAKIQFDTEVQRLKDEFGVLKSGIDINIISLKNKMNEEMDAVWTKFDNDMEQLNNQV